MSVPPLSPDYSRYSILLYSTDSTDSQYLGTYVALLYCVRIRMVGTATYTTTTSSLSLSLLSLSRGSYVP